jgi:hypothetical protein
METLKIKETEMQDKKKTTKKSTKKQNTIMVGIDVGFGNVKIYTEHNQEEIKITFQSRFKKINTESTDVITINGENYTFIEGDLIVDNGHLSKNNDDTRILLWRALHEVYLKTGATTFDVCMNAALDDYKLNSGKPIIDKMIEQKEIAFKERFKKEVVLKINNLACFPECLVGGATVKKQQLQLKDEEVVMIDFGTLNMQGIYVLQGRPEYSKSFATDLGMQQIYRALADLAKLKDRRFATDTSIQLYLEKTAKDPKYIIPEIDDVIMEYLIREVFKKLDLQLNIIKPSIYCKYLLTGGGSATLRRFLETKFIEEGEKIFLEDGYFANSKGLYRKALRLYSESN